MWERGWHRRGSDCVPCLPARGRSRCWCGASFHDTGVWHPACVRVRSRMHTHTHNKAGRQETRDVGEKVSQCAGWTCCSPQALTPGPTFGPEPSRASSPRKRHHFQGVGANITAGEPSTPHTGPLGSGEGYRALAQVAGQAGPGSWPHPIPGHAPFLLQALCAVLHCPYYGLHRATRALPPQAWSLLPAWTGPAAVPGAEHSRRPRGRSLPEAP